MFNFEKPIKRCYLEGIFSYYISFVILFRTKWFVLSNILSLFKKNMFRVNWGWGGREDDFHPLLLCWWLAVPAVER